MNTPVLPTISVVIPAYNEAKNIGLLLRTVFAQEFRQHALSEVIVYSDGSSDRTIEEARKNGDPRLRVIDGHTRRGANAAENALLEEAAGDTVVLLNADTRLGSKDALEKLAQAIRGEPGVGIAAARIVSLPGVNWFERMMALSHAYKRTLYEALRPDYDTVYLCHGRARALSREFARVLRFPDQCPEDAHSYFLCKKMGWRFRYVPEAKVLFRSPRNMTDYVKQSTRFTSGKEVLGRYFPRAVLQAAYRLPLLKIGTVFLRFFLRFPLRMTSYAAILFWIRLTKSGGREQSRWEISETSKQLHT